MSHFNLVANSWDTEDKVALYKKYASEILSLTGEANFKNILEIGCGTGLLGQNFIDEKIQFTGVDTSAGMLDVFEKKFSQYKNVHLKLIDLEVQEIELSQIDLIISAMAFHHLRNPKDLLQRLKHQLSSDAFIAFIDLDEEDGTFHPDPKNMGVHHFGFSEKTVKTWCAELGFKNFKRKTINAILKNDNEYNICLNVFQN